MTGRVELHAALLAILLGFSGAVTALAAERPDKETIIRILLKSYPQQLTGSKAGSLVWRDSTVMPIDDGIRDKDFDGLIANPDIEDQFHFPYRTGPLESAPPVNYDPGRVRNEAFFIKMYGDPGLKSNSPDQVPDQVEANLKTIVWLPKKWGKKIRATRVNGVADKLQLVSNELDELPDKFLRFLKPSNKSDWKYVPGIHSRRCIRGTNRYSVHAFGAAIDLVFTEYWQTSYQPKGRKQKPTTNCKAGPPDQFHRHEREAGHTHIYRNSMPYEIVRIFEKHGFIWGGKWHHFDTMHFEYRPELIEASKQLWK